MTLLSTLPPAIPPASSRGLRQIRRVLTWTATLIFAAVWLTVLRPTVWGGPATYIVIRGTSMLPTYQPGDLVLVRRAAEYGRGDIVGYRVPGDDVGGNMILVHRIVGGSAEEGFDLLGDNNEEEDLWKPRPSEIVGRPLMHVSSAGLILTNLRSPLVLASLAAGAAVAVVAVPKSQSKPAGRPRGRHIRGRRIWSLNLTRPHGAHLA